MFASVCVTLNACFDAVVLVCVCGSETYVPTLMLCSLISPMYLFALQCLYLSVHVYVCMLWM